MIKPADPATPAKSLHVVVGQGERVHRLVDEAAEDLGSVNLALNAELAGRVGAALAEPWRALRDGVLDYADGRVSSSFALAPEVDVRDFEVVVRAPLAYRDGTPVAGTRVERRFALAGDGLEVEERVLARGPAIGLEYRVPSGARAVERPNADEVRYRLP